MGRVIFKNDEIEFIQLDQETIFNCSHCGQMGHEIPVRSIKKKQLKTYHYHCADAVIYKIKFGAPETISSQTLGSGITTPEPKSEEKIEEPKVTKSYLRPVEDDELERKKNKLKALLSDNQPEALAEEMEVLKEKVEVKPKAKIELSEDGKIFITHKYDANLIDKYHFIKQIKFNKDFKVWECNIKDADYETCRFFFKIFKEIPRYDWLISEDAFRAIKKRVEWHEKNMRESKEIKELKSKFDTDIDLSHMKLTPFPYQKVGIAFLDKISGVGMVGDSMGLGKCLVKSSLIYGSWGYLPIKEVFSKYKGELFKIDEDGGEWYYPNQKIYTYSLNKKGQQVKNKIPFLYRQKINTKIKKVLLKDGNEIQITQPHKLLTLKGWTNQFTQNEYVLVPREVKNSTTKSTDIRIIKFLSWLISEGFESLNGNRISISQKDPSILQDLKKDILSYAKDYNIVINNPAIVKSRDIFNLRITSKSLVSHLQSIGYDFGNKSDKKSIPNFILNSSNKEIALFLKGFFEAEGSISLSQRVVEISSASEKLMNQLTFLCRRLGIWMRSSKKQKMATNGLRIKRNYYVGIIGGTSLRQFKDLVGFESKIKNKKLNTVSKAKTNDNIDIIPTLDIFKPLVEKLHLPDSQTGIEHVYYTNQNCSREKLNKVIIQLEKIYTGQALKEYLQIPRSKWTDQVVANFNIVDKIFLKESIECLKLRLEANANYCQIKKVELVDYNDYVYDLTVDNDHNYISNNIYSHNTAQAIGYTSLKKLHTVIVCPASLKYNWKKEVEKFTDKTAIVLTEFEATSLDPKNKMADYVIINYEQLQKYEKYLSKAKFDCIILDESQYIMSLQAKRTKAVFKYFKKCKHRICLSGTPIKNRPLEFYAQLKFLRPDLFSNKMKYALRYCDAKETPFGWDMKGSSNLDELNRKIAPFYIRRLKHEVLKELPSKTITVLDLEMGVTEKAEYQKIQREFDRFMSNNWSQYGNTYEDRRIDGAHLAKLMELKQFCSKIKVEKVKEFVKEFIDSSDNRKIIVFSQFIETQKALRDAFPGNSVSLLGEDSAEKRNEAVEKFQSDPKIRIFVGSTLAAGVGLTLTAADTVVFADLMWSPADHEQAADRIHRIGQENPCFIYYMVYKDSIESMIWHVIGQKLLILSKTLDGKELKEIQPDVVKMVFSSMLKNFKTNNLQKKK